MAANEKTLEQQRTECAQIVKSIKAQTSQLENVGKKISDAESPEFRIHVASIFFSLIDSVTTPTSSVGGGGDNSSLRWDGKNDDEEEDAQRRALFYRAYLIAKGGAGGYKQKL